MIQDLGIADQGQKTVFADLLERAERWIDFLNLNFLNLNQFTLQPGPKAATEQRG
ncbi:MAG: hypothetical protein R3F31_08245 [Verrucomicrobiales bacterium]